MSLHIGEVTSTVNVEGVPPAGGAAAAKAPPPWELIEKHRAMSEVVRDDARRTAAEGFDG